MTVLRDRAYKEVIWVKPGHKGRLLSSYVLIRRGRDTKSVWYTRKGLVGP